MNSSTASLSTLSDGTRTTRSPSTPSGSRLVARIRSRGHRRNVSWAKSAAASRRCSQLSSTSSSSRSPIPSMIDARADKPAPGTNRNAVRHERVHVGRIAAGGQLHQPDTGRVRRADSRGRRQCEPGLADTTGPREHHQSGLGRDRHRPARSRRRDRSAWTPRPAGSPPSRPRDATPGTRPPAPEPSPATRAPGPAKSRSSRRPRSTSPTSSTGDSVNSAAAAPLSTTWPPWAASTSRAQRLSDSPNQSSSRRWADPTCTAMRTLSAEPSLQSADDSARCASIAAATAADTVGNVTHRPSPVCLNSTPACRPIAARRSSSCCPRLCNIPGSDAQARVEPSTSVNSNTTVSISEQYDGRTWHPAPPTVPIAGCGRRSVRVRPHVELARAPAGPTATDVTLTYRWSAVSAAEIREYIQLPPFDQQHLVNSLEHLPRLATEPAAAQIVPEKRGSQPAVAHRSSDL